MITSLNSIFTKLAVLEWHAHFNDHCVKLMPSLLENKPEDKADPQAILDIMQRGIDPYAAARVYVADKHGVEATSVEKPSEQVMEATFLIWEHCFLTGVVNKAAQFEGTAVPTDEIKALFDKGFDVNDSIDQYLSTVPGWENGAMPVQPVKAEGEANSEQLEKTAPGCICGMCRPEDGEPIDSDLVGALRNLNALASIIAILSPRR